MTDQMEEPRGTLLSIFGFLVVLNTSKFFVLVVVNFRRLAVGILQNLRPQCKFDDRLVNIRDRFLSFLNEFPSCVVDSEKMFDVRGIVAGL